MNNMKRKCLGVISICLAVCLLFGLTKNYVVAAPMVGENNTSNKIYKWTHISNYDVLWDVVTKTNKPYRLLLLCGEAYSKEKPPKIQEYAIFDRSDENHAFSYEKVSAAKQLAYDEKVFFTRGSLQTPFIEFTGETHSDGATGDNAPKCKIYMHDASDNKSNVTLCCVDGDYTSTQTKLWTPETYEENEEDWPRKKDEWIFFFPAVTYPEGYASGNSGYLDAIEGYIGLGSTVAGKGGKLSMIDWDEDFGTTKYTEEISDTKYMLYTDSNESLFKCYIGEEIDTSISGTFTVLDGQSKSLSGTTLIEEGSVIRVEEGGTLFISGTCYHNGLIINEGGTVVLQKGAVMTQADSVYNTAGMIQLNGGNFIVRTGARLVLDEQKSEGRCDISLGGNAYFLNQGVTSLINDIKITSKDAVLENAASGTLYCGYQLKKGRDLAEGYLASKMDYPINAYIQSREKECISRVEKKRDGYIYNDGGRVINEGTCYANGY